MIWKDVEELRIGLRYKKKKMISLLLGVVSLVVLFDL